MNDKNEQEISLDILKHVENLSEQINLKMASNTKSIFRRYPLTFALLVLFGVVAVTEGIKGVYLLFTGLLILIITGSVYKKLDK